MKSFIFLSVPLQQFTQLSSRKAGTATCSNMFCTSEENGRRCRPLLRLVESIRRSLHYENWAGLLVFILLRKKLVFGEHSLLIQSSFVECGATFCDRTLINLLMRLRWRAETIIVFMVQTTARSWVMYLFATNPLMTLKTESGTMVHFRRTITHRWTLPTGSSSSTVPENSIFFVSFIKLEEILWHFILN